MEKYAKYIALPALLAALAVVLLLGLSRQLLFTPRVEAVSPATQWVLPYVTDFTGVVDTRASVQNSGGSTSTVTVEFRDSSGSTIASISSNVPAGETWVLCTAGSALACAVSNQAVKDFEGWAQVVSTGPVNLQAAVVFGGPGGAMELTPYNLSAPGAPTATPLPAASAWALTVLASILLAVSVFVLRRKPGPAAA